MNGTILCIDDAPQILMLYQRLFEEQGYKVVLATNGQDGLYALKSHPVDCVILDYQMPEMDGAAVVRHMIGREVSPPVILVSGSDPPLELLAQVNAFIEKPFVAAHLLECVGSAIGVHAEKQHDDIAEKKMIERFLDSIVHN